MSPSSEALVECRAAACGYPSRVVLKGIDLTLTSGSITALLGPNGSGKSTLLKSIAKLIPVLGGEILVTGQNVQALSYADLAQKVSFVPQEEQPAFGFTVRELVVMGRLPRSRGLFDTEEDHAAATRAMEAADCLHLQDRVVTEISGGERQRALVARALAQEAQVMLLDEPTSHLDVGHQLAILRLLKHLAAKGMAILVAVHDLNLASMLADRAMVLSGDGIALAGPTQEVLRDETLDRIYDVAFSRHLSAEGHVLLYPGLLDPAGSVL
jgi:iron complex transport system ATP-binding protein